MNSLLDKIKDQNKTLITIQTSTKKSEEVLGKILALQEKEAKKKEKDRKDLASRLKREQQTKKRLSADRLPPDKLRDKIKSGKGEKKKGLLESLFGGAGLLKALGLGAIGAAIVGYIKSPEFKKFVDEKIFQPIGDFINNEFKDFIVNQVLNPLGDFVRNVVLPTIEKLTVAFTDKIVRWSDSALDDATRSLPAYLRNRNRLEAPVEGMEMTRNDTERLVEFAKAIKGSKEYEGMSEKEKAFTDAFAENAKKMDKRMEMIYDMSSQIDRRKITLDAQKKKLEELKSQKEQNFAVRQSIKSFESEIKKSEKYIEEREIYIKQSRVILKKLQELNFKVDNKEFKDKNFIIDQINNDRKLLNEAFGRNTPLIKKQKGGPIRVPGTGSGDTVPALLPPGSFVLNRNATNAFFQDGGRVPAMLEPGEMVFPKANTNLEKMNNAVPRFGQRKDNGAPSEDNVLPQGMIKGYQKGGKVFLHWAGSGYTGASDSYHATVQGDGSVVQTRDYNKFGGAHTSERNSEGIGISLAAMSGASDSNFGKYPVKKEQYESMAKLVAGILQDWGHGPEYVTRSNVLTHSEAGTDGDSKGNYGPRPEGGTGERWDLWKLFEGDAGGTGGDKIRGMIKDEMKPLETYNASKKYETGDRVKWTDGSTRVFDGMGWDKPENMTTSVNRPRRQPGMPDYDNNTSTPTAPKLDVLGSFMKGLRKGLGKYSGLADFFFGNAGKSDSDKKDGDNSGIENPGVRTDNTTSTEVATSGATSVSNPNARALLNAIADAEGTSKYPNGGYLTMFTGKQFKNMADHPRQIQSSNGYSSDAAGRYQFLGTTWDEYSNGRNMMPENQDNVALDLVAKKRGVNINDGLSMKEIYKLGQEWASIEGGPRGVPGGSYGGQAKFSAEKFMKMYEGYGGQVQKRQTGGLVGAKLEPGESVFLPHMMNEAVPRFQAGGSIKSISGTTGEVTSAFREAGKKRLAQKEVNNIIVINSGGGRQRPMVMPQIGEPGASTTVPSLPSGPSDGVNSVIRQIRMHAIG